jgi:hypothetical protein
MESIFAGFLWLVGLPFHITVAVVKYPLSPIAVYTCSVDDDKHLCWPFRWLETIDNDLGGDSGWRKEHIEPGSDPYSDWNRTMWLWRNGGNWFNYNVLGIDAYPKSQLPPQESGLTTRDDGFWVLRDRFGISSNSDLEVFWGWGLYGNIQGMNKFSFTTRIVNKK